VPPSELTFILLIYLYFARSSEIFHWLFHYNNHNTREFLLKRVWKKTNDEQIVVAYGDAESCEGITLNNKKYQVSGGFARKARFTFINKNSLCSAHSAPCCAFAIACPNCTA